MTARDFRGLCNHLAKDGGGFTLWTGAGASIAGTRGALPSWVELLRDLGEVDVTGDLPLRLEKLSQRIGHRRFRQELRKRLIASIGAADFDQENLLDQAVIAARAGALVSFNIEFLAASAHCLLRPTETFLPRTFRQRRASVLDTTTNTHPGLIGSPIYFPHGLLLQGSVVLTKSEYDRHLGSVAMTTAVHLCVGADLVILGMSLSDEYLRAALLQNRSWLRDVYWVGEVDGFMFHEWARVADVKCIDCRNADVWRGLAEAIVQGEPAGRLQKLRDVRRPQIPAFVESLMKHQVDYGLRLGEAAKKLVRESRPIEELTALADFTIDTGYEVSVDLANAVGIAAG